MTIGSWILFAFFAICIIALGLFMVFEIENIAGKIISAVALVLSKYCLRSESID